MKFKTAAVFILILGVLVPGACNPVSAPDLQAIQATVQTEGDPTATPPMPDQPAPPGQPLNISIAAPAGNSTVRGTVQVTATVSGSVTRVEFYVDGALRHQDEEAPYIFPWDAFHERFGTHATGVHSLHAIAYDAAGLSAGSADVPIWVLPAAAGDCNGDGSVDAADLAAIASEVNDGDGTNTENTPGGHFMGNPACDANEDNLVDPADAACAQQITAQGPGACLDRNSPLVVPLIFVPRDLAASVDQDVIDFVENKIQETRRFYARANNGKTFRALPLEVVYTNRDHLEYWVDGQNYEYGVLQELQARQYPVNVDWAQTPSDRVVWVLAMGSGGWAGGRHYATGSGFSMWGDGLLFAAMDLNCDRVVDGIAGQGIAGICRNSWLPSGRIYAFGIGGAVHELGHGFNLPHPPEGDPAWETSVMGGHWNYPDWRAPANGLADADRALLGSSHYFPGFSDTSFPTAGFLYPTDGSTVSGMVAISMLAVDNDGVRSMLLTLDGTPVALPPAQSPENNLVNSYAWNTGQTAEDWHTLELIVTDTGGNVTKRSVRVKVEH